MDIRVAIVGCGMIGKRRAQALAGARLVGCADIDIARAEALAHGFPDCLATTDWQTVVHRDDVEAVIVATPHKSLAVIAENAVRAGKHVLVEKPGARHVSELLSIRKLGENNDSLIRVGFNHRYHRAFRQARQIADSGALGQLMFVRARYGHGGRLGYEKEWRGLPEISGGGELIDQGTHIIDLARWFLGEFSEVIGSIHTYFWSMPVEDNAFLLLKTKEQKTAFLHASCTEWKNTFSFEIYGQDGKLQIEGLGGSYGTERLAHYKMRPEMGPPETTIWEYPMADDSWNVEVREFLDDIRLHRKPAVTLDDAIAVLDIVDKIYRTSGYDYRA